MNIKQKIEHLILMFLILSSFSKGEINHEIILKNGSSENGYVSKITHDSVNIVLRSNVAISLLLDSILYIHNTKGKLFYIDPQINTFFKKAIGRGGFIRTVKNDTIHYREFQNQLFMYNPKVVYENSSDGLRKEIQLRDIRSVHLDNSISDLAVKKGALIGLGITSLGFLLNYRAIKEFYNFNKVFRTGVTAYRQGVGFIPLSSVSYVIYDYFKGRREIIINPLDFKD
tara:strand:+ start:5639 stop:6322 length:684 start_codon:yes stop_codon:yes gene_type:complete